MFDLDLYGLSSYIEEVLKLGTNKKYHSQYTSSAHNVTTTVSFYVQKIITRFFTEVLHKKEETIAAQALFALSE